MSRISTANREGTSVSHDSSRLSLDFTLLKMPVVAGGGRVKEVLGQLLVEFPEGKAEMPADLGPTEGLLDGLCEEDDFHRDRGRKDQFYRNGRGPRQGIGHWRHDANGQDEP